MKFVTGAGSDGESRSAPRELADVEVPVTAIRDTDGFLFEFVNYFLELDVSRQNIDEQISGTNRKDARALVRTAKIGRFNRVDGIDVAADSRDTVLIFLDGADKVPVRFTFEPSTVDHMEFFAWL